MTTELNRKIVRTSDGGVLAADIRGIRAHPVVSGRFIITLTEGFVTHDVAATRVTDETAALMLAWSAGIDTPRTDAGLRERVLAVMMDTEGRRMNDIRDMEMLDAGDEERYGRLDARATTDGKTLEALRVALGLPCEWREAVTS